MSLNLFVVFSTSGDKKKKKSGKEKLKE